MMWRYILYVENCSNNNQHIERNMSFPVVNALQSAFYFQIFFLKRQDSIDAIKFAQTGLDHHPFMHFYFLKP